MFGFVIRGVLALAAIATGVFVAEDAPNFGVIQGMVGIAMIAVVVIVVALWPKRWR
jgi:membrane protein DedA with SNARE-associated domain